MLGQLIAVLQLAGVFATFLGAYIFLLEYLMPSSSDKLQISTEK
ncbi:hypothetical protein [[Limnothrix rosea] IAM M-220]|nr:hypothetical protein [[Limnothrix rosea] IAM M-220]